MTGKYFKIVLVILLIIGVFYAPINRAEQAQAGFFGILANCLKTVLIRALVTLFVSAVIAFLFTVPVFDAPSLGDWVKNYIKDPLARCIVRGVFDEVVGSMLDVIRKKGRDGGASYVRNWRNFQTQAQYRGEDVFRGVVVNTPMCDYLRGTVDESVGITTQSKIPLLGINLRINALHPFALSGKCPLPPGFNLAAYEFDPLANGGWAAFDRMLLPSGNIYGMKQMADAELVKQRGLAEVSDINTASLPGILPIVGSEIAGTLNNPYIGQACQSDLDCQYGSDTSVTCVGNPGICTLTGTPPAEPPCLIPNVTGGCTNYADIRSPASYVQGVLEQQVNQEMAWITNVDELRELVINYIFVRLTNRLKDLGADEQLPEYTDAESGFAPDGTTATGGLGPPPPLPTPTGTPDPACMQSCTGNNPNCICVKPVPPGQCSDPTWPNYQNVAGWVCTAIQQAYSAPCNNTTPIPGGWPNAPQVLQGICNAYNANSSLPGTCTPAGNDNVSISGLSFPYPTVNADVFAGSNPNFWAQLTAACGGGGGGGGATTGPPSF